MANKAFIDANVILRLVRGEPADQAQAAVGLFNRAAGGEFLLIIHPTVLAEVIYVLTSPRVADLHRPKVAAALRSLFGLDGVEVPDLDRTLEALRRFEATNLDWVDCLILSHSTGTAVYSFDQKMLRAGAVDPFTFYSDQQEPTDAPGGYRGPATD